MVNIETVGMGLTLILLTASVFISAIAIAEPDNSFGMNESMNNLTVGDVDVIDLVDKFNSDFNTFSNSDGLNQIPLGATVIVTVLSSAMNFFLLGVLGWTVLIDLLFAWTTDPTIILLGTMLKIFFGIVIFITIANFVGRVIRGLPFFGGG